MMKSRIHAGASWRTVISASGTDGPWRSEELLCTAVFHHRFADRKSILLNTVGRIRPPLKSRYFNAAGRKTEPLHEVHDVLHLCVRDLTESRGKPCLQVIFPGGPPAWVAHRLPAGSDLPKSSYQQNLPTQNSVGLG